MLLHVAILHMALGVGMNQSVLFMSFLVVCFVCNTR